METNQEICCKLHYCSNQIANVNIATNYYPEFWSSIRKKNGQEKHSKSTKPQFNAKHGNVPNAANVRYDRVDRLLLDVYAEKGFSIISINWLDI